MSILDIFRPRQKRAAQGEVPSLSASSYPYIVSNNATAETCIRKISTTLASLKLTLYQHRKGGGRTPVYTDPLYSALRNPDPSTTPFLWYAQLVDDILRGDAYVQHKRIGGNLFLYRLDPNTTRPEVESGRRVFATSQGTFTPAEVLHIPYPRTQHGKGYSPLQQFDDLISLDNILTAYIREYFRNSTGKRTVLELGDDYKGKKMDELYSAIIPLVNKYIVGAGNAGKPIIPPPGMKLSTHDVTQNLYADLKSLKEMVERQIAQSFGVPYSLISETNKYDSLEQNQLQFLTDAIEPIGTHIEQSFSKLIPPANTAWYCKYDYKAMLQSDPKTTVDYLAKEVGSGLLTINEARDVMDLPAVEGGDVLLVPANMWPYTPDNQEAFFAKAKAALGHNGAGDDKQ